MMTGTMKTLLLFVQAYPPSVLSTFALVYEHLQRDGGEVQVLLTNEGFLTALLFSRVLRDGLQSPGGTCAPGH